MKSSEIIPIQTLHLFPILDTLLVDLLKSLTEEEWNAQTVAKKWKVKDIASHLLDGNLEDYLFPEIVILEKIQKTLIRIRIWSIS